MRTVAGFHTRNDEWILSFKLRTLSTFCDVIVVCLDRPSPETREIVKRFPKAIPFEHVNSLGLPDVDETRGPLCEEGRMRQITFDLMSTHDPDFMVLGDTDEILTPDVATFLQVAYRKYPEVDYFKLDIVNLYRGEDLYVSGPRCIWSFEDPRSNKRASIIRYRKGRKYSYPDKPCHVPLEPSSGVPVKGLYRPNPKVLHYKFADWDRWLGTYKASMKKYQAYWQGLETSPTPREWLWDLNWRER